MTQTFNKVTYSWAFSKDYWLETDLINGSRGFRNISTVEKQAVVLFFWGDRK